MKLEEKELQTIQTLHQGYTKIKLTLGEIELHKVEVLKEVEGLKGMLATEEQKLVDKYGPNQVLNIETGELTEKENG